MMMKLLFYLSLLATPVCAFKSNKKNLFDEFIVNYDKKYLTPEEYQTRFNIFSNNLDFIDNHNQENNTQFTLEINQFADLHRREYRDYLNYNANIQFGNSKCQENPSLQSNLEKVPYSVDWRNQNAVTPVKNQGQCGSCWAFSSTGALEGSNAIVNGELVSLSEQQFVDCSGSYGNNGCSGGIMDDAFTYAMEHSVCSEQNYSYEGSDGSCHKCSGQVRVKSCYNVPSNNELALKKAVSLQPVSIAIEADQSQFQFYSKGVFSGKCGTKLDHGVLLVGYGEEDSQLYWLVKNSWGPKWGDSGYIKIARNDTEGQPGLCGIAMTPSYPVVEKEETSYL
jgi:KDEL-tailed cysteine endopeptidase